MKITHKIALFYGSSTCYTQMTAEKIAQVFGEEKVDLFNIADEPINTAEQYQNIIMGIPTWDYGELQEDWEEIWDDIAELELTGSKVALYGQGDQEGYPEWFLDAMGYLYHHLKATGAEFIGKWPVAGFNFEQSKALLDDDHFVGLALDDETQFAQSAERINTWCQQLAGDFGVAIKAPLSA